jgi:hypothetical protein
MPTPMAGTPMPMPSPNMGPGGVRPQTPTHMPMPTPGGIGVIPPVIPPSNTMVGMAMPSPSIGAGVMPQQLKFNGYGRYAGLLCHSADTVVFEDDLYPTALHLFEAHKFLGGRPDLAERIRQCQRVEDVTALSAEMEDFARQDWGNVALAKVSFLSFHIPHVISDFFLIIIPFVVIIFRWTKSCTSSSGSTASCALCSSERYPPSSSTSSLGTRSGEMGQVPAGTNLAIR